LGLPFLEHELSWIWSAGWANSSTRTTISASIGINDVKIISGTDSTYWTFCLTSSTADALRINYICHCIQPLSPHSQLSL